MAYSYNIYFIYLQKVYFNFLVVGYKAPTVVIANLSHVRRIRKARCIFLVEMYRQYTR